jgi:iron(III) transport system ATP-binding protein
MTLSLQHVTKVFGTAQRAVDDVSYDFERGKLYTILGPSGCGKTTLLRMIAGFEQPTAGDIMHNGTRINDVPPYRRGFPMVFQSYALFPHMTVLDNVAYGLRVRNVPARERSERARRMLALLGLDAYERRHPAQLSGGQQQRVALARALVLEPEMILLDEPLSNLDAGLRVSMRSEIRALQQRVGISAIYVTHDQEEALAISDVVVVMNEGRIEQSGLPVEVYQKPRSEFVARFMGCPNVFPLERGADGRAVLFGAPFEAPTPPAGATRVMVRSDAVVVTTGADKQHDATVDEAAFLGSHVRYVLRLHDGTRVEADAPAGARVHAAGENVGIRVLHERLHFF